MDNLTTLARAFEVDVYPDECPTLPEADYHDPEPEASDPATWPAWVDDDVWALGPMPEHGRPLPAHEVLAEQVKAEARKHRRLDTPLHDLIADELLSLAHNIKRTQAATPIEYEARMEIVDRDLIADAEERGYDAGYSAGLAASF